MFTRQYLLVGLSACMAPTPPDNIIPTSTPEAQGVSSAALLAFLDAIEATHQDPDDGIEWHSFILIRHGHRIAEGWWDPYAPEHPHMLFSLSKSFTATAIGLAEAEGLLTLDDPVLSFFPEAVPDTTGPFLPDLRIVDLLTMSTGQTEEGGPDPDWVRTFLAHPIVHEPGTVYRYNTMATFMLSAIIERASGEPLHAYLEPRLFEPLGIKGATWDTNPQGIDIGGAGLNLTTEDIARFGLLYLQQGQWQGTPGPTRILDTGCHISPDSYSFRLSPEPLNQRLGPGLWLPILAHYASGFPG